MSHSASYEKSDRYRQVANDQNNTDDLCTNDRESAPLKSSILRSMIHKEPTEPPNNRENGQDQWPSKETLSDEIGPTALAPKPKSESEKNVGDSANPPGDH